MVTYFLSLQMVVSFIYDQCSNGRLACNLALFELGNDVQSTSNGTGITASLLMKPNSFLISLYITKRNNFLLLYAKKHDLEITNPNI